MGFIDVVKKLLEFGADIEAVSANGDTPLKSARDPQIHTLLTGSSLSFGLVSKKENNDLTITMIR